MGGPALSPGVWGQGREIAMGIRWVGAGLVIGALWDLFTTFYGIASYFDLPLNPEINPVQFAFALSVTAVVFGFVIASHLIWKLPEDTPGLLIKAAWAACIAIDLVTSWEGTKDLVFYGDEADAGKNVGLAIVTALIVSSTIFLSWLVLKDAKGKLNI